ncbi:MAG: peptidase domain-containing ABC transporter [Bacteroidota bacterium]
MALTSLKKFPFYSQMDRMDCGPACLQMVAKHYGKFYQLPDLRKWCHLDREGVSLGGIATGAERIGLRTLAVRVPLTATSGQPSLSNAPLPAIVHWNQNHFVVVYKIGKNHIWIADPSKGKIKVDRDTFMKAWLQENPEGIALLLEKGREFDLHEEDQQAKIGFSFLLPYVKPYMKLLSQVGLGLILGALLSLIFPFLTQAIVDVGIQNQNIGFIYLVLIGQLFLFFSQTVVTFIQNWILLHIGTRVNVSLISDFLAKLMKLPLGYFDAKMTGDLLQRISDHRRIETFLTQSTMSVLFSTFNLIVFSIILLIYSLPIFLVFIVAAILYFGWIAFFLKKRREIDYRAFQQYSRNQDSKIEIIQGIQEIKLQGSQLKRRWKWAEIQARLFRVQISWLALGQYQEAGALFINQLKDIIITVLAASAVITGELTLGMMLAIQYIIGQLNAPLQQLIAFISSAQDAKISLERLEEIHAEPEELPEQNITPSVEELNGNIVIENISFRYNALYDWVLENLSLVIPKGKVTAIVGNSGSGKTTLLKLLLGFYNTEQGSIRVNNFHLNHLELDLWRRQCGAVMQDGFIFSDTIANNIAESDDQIDYIRLNNAIHIANIQGFLQKLPLGLNTMIGAQGNGLSQGQKQRLLIARAAYREPNFLFFDEATNSLDANNERTIIERLNEFFDGRTVVVVAHRLSTVKNADQIIVLDQGKVVEQGTHEELTTLRGAYYTLVKNQLELGN